MDAEALYEGGPVSWPSAPSQPVLAARICSIQVCEVALPDDMGFPGPGGKTPVSDCAR